GERGVWRVVGEVANPGPEDPAYDLTNVVSGRRRIFRASRLTVVRAARPGRRCAAAPAGSPRPPPPAWPARSSAGPGTARRRCPRTRGSGPGAARRTAAARP